MTSRTGRSAAHCAAGLFVLALSSGGALAENRSYDGSGNNLLQLDWGSSGALLLREDSGAHYIDGVGQMITSRPSARAVSNTIGKQTKAQDTNARGLSTMLWQWGQFIDHDFAKVGQNPAEAANISVPMGDPSFDPFFTGSAQIGFSRSECVETPGGPRQQINSISSYLDGSMVYGSDSHRASALRSYTGGRLAEGAAGFMPMNTGGYENDNPLGMPDGSLYLGGDSRANEVVGLAGMHTLFVREHNRLADSLAAQNQSWDDEQVYQTARKIVGAKIQKITYDEFLPALLGDGSISQYAGYDQGVEATLSNAFSSAGFRVGHTMLNAEYTMLNEDRSVHDIGSLDVRTQFFNAPNLIEQEGAFDALFRGMAHQQANEVDTQVVDDVRDFLFGPPGSGGMDLLSLNVQRGRDHGIADYNTLRADFGLGRIENWADITADADMQAQLQSLYSSVDDIDPWVGLMAEDHLAGSSLGETLTAIIGDQFERLRDGDRFFYLNDAELAVYMDEIEDTTLSQVILENTGIDWMQENVFFASPVPAPAGALVVAAGLLGATRRRR